MWISMDQGCGKAVIELRHAFPPEVTLARAAAWAPFGTGNSQAIAGTPDYKIALELEQSRNMPKNQTAVGCCGIDLGADPDTGEHAQINATAVQFLDRRQQMFQVASQAI